MFRHESWQLAKLPIDNPPYSQMGAHSLLVAAQPFAAVKPPAFAQLQQWKSAWVLDGRSSNGALDAAWLKPYEVMSLEQRQGTNAKHCTAEIELMVPQGCAGPKVVEALHALLNAVPEMQHWPSGNDIARCAVCPVSYGVPRFPPYKSVGGTPLEHSSHRVGACGLP